MKKCPFCAEEIQDEAVKCRHCNEFLTTSRIQQLPSSKPSIEWYYRMSTIIWGFICVGPLILPLVWFNPRLKMVNKIVITAVLLLISWILTKITVYYWNQYFDMFKELGVSF